MHLMTTVWITYYSNNSYFDGSRNGGFQYGGGLEVMLHPSYGVELLYLRLDSDAPMYYWGAVAEEFQTLNVAHNYIMLGFNRYMEVNSKLEVLWWVSAWYGCFQC